MAVLTISYDLYKEPGRAYAKLRNAIKSQGTWCRPAESTWFVKTTKSPRAMMEHLAPHLHEKDKVVITKVAVAGAWCSRGLSDGVRKWLHTHLVPAKKV